MVPLDRSFPKGLSSFLLMYSVRASVTTMLFPVMMMGTLLTVDMERAVPVRKAKGLVKAETPVSRRNAVTNRMLVE